MEKVFYNGCIGTQDGNDDFCEAVGIENGKISFVGSTEDAMKELPECFWHSGEVLPVSVP